MQWLRYTVTGTVPAKNRSWVLYDATCSTWLARHAARYLVIVAPLIAAVLILLPATMEIRVEASFAAGASLLLGYLCFTSESVERRVEKAGYPRGLAASMREQRALDAQRATAARNRVRRGGYR